MKKFENPEEPVMINPFPKSSEISEKSLHPPVSKACYPIYGPVEAEGANSLTQKRNLKSASKAEALAEIVGEVKKVQKASVYKSRKGILIGIKRMRNEVSDPINEITLAYDKKGQIKYKRVVTESEQVLSNLNHLDLNKQHKDKQKVRRVNYAD